MFKQINEMINNKIDSLYKKCDDIDSRLFRYTVINKNVCKSAFYALSLLKRNLYRLEIEILKCLPFDCLNYREPHITFRLANVDDGLELLAWRNDLETRQASFNEEEVGLIKHFIWLNQTLKDHKKRLFIAEKKGKKLGVVRIDFLDKSFELSWTVNPDYRGQGIGTKMVCMVTKEMKLVAHKPITARVRQSNFASMFIAQKAGLKLDKLVNDVAYYIKKEK